MEEVFWGEAHDEAQEIVSSTEWLRRRLICLFALSDTLIFHPSYIWRSDVTRNFVLKSFSPLFTPEFSALILGDAPSVEGYIFDRYKRLRYASKYGPTSIETLNYHRNLANIAIDAPRVDNILTFSNAIYTGLQGSRDKRLRELLSTDLSDAAGFDSSSLRSLIIQLEGDNRTEHEVHGYCDSLQLWVKDSPFVSREAMIQYMEEIGLKTAAHSSKVKIRLLYLYLKSNVTSKVEVPFLRSMEHAFDKYHPRVFEMFFQSLIGRKLFHHLYYTVDNRTLSYILHEIKTEPAWLSSRNLYLASISKLNSAISANHQLAGIFMKTVAYSEYKPIAVNLAQKARWILLAVMFDAMSFDLFSGFWSTIGTLGSAGLTIWEIAKEIKPTMDALRSTNRQIISQKLKWTLNGVS